MSDPIFPTDHLEQPDCPLCAERRSVVRYTWPGTPGWRVVRCAACGFHYLSPRPLEEVVRRMYAQGTYYAGDSGGYDDYAAQESALRLTFRRLMRTLHKRGLTGGSLLEIGCGYGYLLAEARDFFDHLEATDYAAIAAHRAEAWADRVHVGGIASVERDDFDLVIANHVVEHVYDPKRFVAELSTRLKPGGRLVLSTPNMGSLWRKALGRRWPSFKLPEHVLYFDRESLGRLMADAGLTEVQRIPYPHAFPLSLVAAKLGLPIPSALGSLSLWIPGTTLALSGKSILSKK